jgi:hypothetical protein
MLAGPAADVMEPGLDRAPQASWTGAAASVSPPRSAENVRDDLAEELKVAVELGMRATNDDG